jgi:hypothetical protein
MVGEQKLHRDVAKYIVSAYAPEPPAGDRLSEFCILYLNKAFALLKLDLRHKYQDKRLTVGLRTIPINAGAAATSWILSIEYDVASKTHLASKLNRLDDITAVFNHDRYYNEPTGINQEISFDLFLEPANGDTRFLHQVEIFSSDINGSLDDDEAYVAPSIKNRLARLRESIVYPPGPELNSRHPILDAYKTNGLPGVKVLLEYLMQQIRKIAVLIIKGAPLLDPAVVLDPEMADRYITFGETDNSLLE